MKRILVTGGAGYIGSHACKALKRAGFEPVTYDNLSTGWREAVKFGPLVEADLNDRAALNAAFEKYQPAAVMHFGALSDVGQSVREPELYHRNNVEGSKSLLDAMDDAGCNRIVFSSTCATYGEQDGVALTEDTQQKPINPYGASKLEIERLIKQREDSHGLCAVIFRYFNVAGADPEAEVGEFHRPETHLVPLVLDAIMGRREALTVFGTDYNTPDGTCIRDYVHVSDLIQAHVLGLNWLLEGNPSNVFNLGTRDGFSVYEVLNAAKDITGVEVPAKAGDRRAGDCTSLICGSDKAEKMLGWTPANSTIEQMISDAWRWHKIADYKS